MLEAVASMFHTAEWSIPGDFLSKDHYLRVIRQKIDWTSSPGFPYMRRAPTNGDLFRVKEGVPSEDEVERYWLVVQNRLREKDSDPIRLFVKAEPHKVKKLENHRYRLISSVSVVDQIVDHMLFGEMNDTMVREWPTLPTRPGWTHLVGGWRAMPVEAWVATDKSGWDWSVQPWLLEMALQVRARLCRNLDERWLEMARWRYLQLYENPVFVTSGGLQLRQLRPGVQKSGCVNTIADNSIMQVILHIRVCMEIDIPAGRLITMGDDVLQEPLEDEERYLEQLGQYCHVKQAAHVNEFAGFRFCGKNAEPLYRGKHAFALLHANEDLLQEICDSYLLLYHRSTLRGWMRSLFQDMGLDVKPVSWCDAIFDGL